MTSELAVTGITCAGCVRSVADALKAVPGVEDASVNFATRRASIRFSPPADEASLIRAIEDAGYGVAKPEDPEPSVRPRLMVAAALTIPLLVIAMGPWMHRHDLRWAQFLLAAPVVFWSGAPFFRAAWKGLKRRRADMNTLISIGAGSAFLYSAITTALGSRGHVYFEAAAVILTFLLTGRLLEERARGRASAAIRQLAELTPKQASVLRGGFEVMTPIEDIRPGDRIVVRPGGRIPVDGVIVQGEPAIDEASLTGESVPSGKRPGDSVFAGTVNTTRTFTFEAKAVGRDTMLSSIVAMVERAQSQRAPIARLADEVSAWFVPAVLGVALLTLIAWMLAGDRDAALTHFVSVLIVACPCALGLATPAAILVATGRAAQLGILFKNGEAIERAARVDTVVFDKTGTLTQGTPSVAAVEGSEETLILAAAVEQWSEHPIAKAIVACSAPIPSDSFEAIPGCGAKARVGGSSVTVETDSSRPGGSWLLVTRDGQSVGSILVRDALRPEAQEAVAALHALHYETYLLSGDRKVVAEGVAQELGIRNALAPVLPHQKAERIRKLQGQGKRVAMVGDGINDAPALAAADAGIALGSGTDIALEAAHISLISTGGGVDLRKVAQALGLARRALRTIRVNLFWAFAYNVVGIPLAAGVLKPFTGLELTPMFAAAAMALSSLSVLANSLRLRRA
jgi:Cu+-exporting ATPase